MAFCDTVSKRVFTQGREGAKEKMMKRILALLVSGLSVLLACSTLSAGEVIKLSDCTVAPDAEVWVPAQEAGVLKEMPVDDGQHVKTGDLLAQIDDLIPQRQKEVAENKLKAAKEEAGSTVGIKYAKASYAVAQAQYRLSAEANFKTPGSVPDARLNEFRLKVTESELSIEKADKDHRVAEAQAGVAQAELKAADANLEHRHITSVLDAEVVDVKRHVGEWVSAGDSLMRLLRLDVMRVEGSVNAAAYQPAEIFNCPVTVTVELARGKKAEFTGKVVFVNPTVDPTGTFQVRAEVKNRQEEGFWVLRPGTIAEMAIQLK
jgi:multidrug efflux pump subunit AcrA (membrane-fusion protein)